MHNDVPTYDSTTYWHRGGRTVDMQTEADDDLHGAQSHRSSWKRSYLSIRGRHPWAEPPTTPPSNEDSCVAFLLRRPVLLTNVFCKALNLQLLWPRLCISALQHLYIQVPLCARASPIKRVRALHPAAAVARNRRKNTAHARLRVRGAVTVPYLLRAALYTALCRTHRPHPVLLSGPFLFADTVTPRRPSPILPSHNLSPLPPRPLPGSN